MAVSWNALATISRLDKNQSSVSFGLQLPSWIRQAQKVMHSTLIERVTSVGRRQSLPARLQFQDFLNRAASSEPFVALPSL
jgi:hypothetical protein